MKEQRFEKVVKYEEYSWQKGEIDISHVIFFIFGIGFSLFLSGNRILTIIGLWLIICIIIISSTLKQKVYWRKIK